MEYQLSKNRLRFLLYKWYRQLRRRFVRDIPTQFQQRIQKRWEIFWRDADDLHLIREKLSAYDDISKWKDIVHWQRRLENKYNAKEFALKNNCKVAKMYWFGNRDEFIKLDIKTLPSCYTIKPNFGESSRDVFLIKDGFCLFHSNYIAPDQLKEKILGIYNSIEGSEFLIEEFLANQIGQKVIPNDYKFYCFNGKILFIQVNERNSIDKDEISFYDEDWNLIRRKLLRNEKINIKTPKPPPNCYSEMLFRVKSLSKIYERFVRIDFYSTDNGAVFGEFTATPRRGKHFTKYASQELIYMWDRYCKGMI